MKGATRDFLQSPHCASNRVQHVRSSGPGAIVFTSRASHRALIVCNMSYNVPRGTQGQFCYLNLTELKSHLFELYFIGCTINLPGELAGVNVRAAIVRMFCRTGKMVQPNFIYKLSSECSCVDMCGVESLPENCVQPERCLPQCRDVCSGVEMFAAV